MLFDGSNDYVRKSGITNSSLDATNKVVMSAWVVPNTLSQSGWVYSTGAVNNKYMMFFTATDFLFRLKFDNELYTKSIVTASHFTVGQLHHVACVYDGAYIKLYVNGEETGSFAETRNISVGNTDQFNIGTHSTSGDPFDGLINEVSVFTNFDTFGADEVSELYNNGTPLDATTHSKVDNLQGYWRNDGDDVWVDRTPTRGPEKSTDSGFDDATSWDTHTGWSISGSAAHASAASAGFYVSQDMSLVSGKTYEVTYTCTSHTSGQFGIVLNAEAGDLTRNNIGTFTEQITVGTVSTTCGIRAGGGLTASFSNISVKEVKGGNDGTVSGSPETILLPEARNGRDTMGMPINNVNNGYLALHGDGYVEVADDASLDITSEITLEAWVKLKEASYGALFFKDTWSSAYGVYVSNTYFRPYISGVSYNYDYSFGTDVWHHIIATYDGTTLKHYINSDEVNSQSVTGSITTNATTMNIGSNNTGGETMSIDIDEPRIYNRALTEAEVLQNYNAGKSKHRND
jgi:hypothetical protein